MSFTPKAVKDEELKKLNFSQLATELEPEEFCDLMHRRLVQATLIIAGDDEEFNEDDVNRVLAEYPALYSWAFREETLISYQLKRLEDGYDDWYNGKYSDAAKTVSGKATKDAINAEVVVKNKEELKTKRDARRRLEANANMAKGLVRVMGATISSLQSLSSNLKKERQLAESHYGN